MALKLYRRHRKECEGGHPEDSRTGEFEEGRRGRKKCAASFTRRVRSQANSVGSKRKISLRRREGDGIRVGGG
jgi:hypothetical protein